MPDNIYKKYETLITQLWVQIIKIHASVKVLIKQNHTHAVYQVHSACQRVLNNTLDIFFKTKAKISLLCILIS